MYQRLQADWNTYSAQYQGATEWNVWAVICTLDPKSCRGDLHEYFNGNDMPDPPGNFDHATSFPDGQGSILIGSASAAGIFYVRSLLKPDTMIGATQDEIEALIPSSSIPPQRRTEGR
jgi:hypothetical protein